MAFAMVSLLVIKHRGPIAEADRLSGKLMEGLAEEFRTSPPKVNPAGFAALLRHRSDSEEGNHFHRALEPFSVSAEGRK
jgi:hypothetical protein